MQLSLRILLSIVLTFSLVSCAPDPLDTVSEDLSNNTTVNYDYSKDEADLAVIINDYRVALGLNKLELNNYVSVISEEHDLYMIQNNDVSHAGFQERADEIIHTLGVRKVNENIAYNYRTSQSAMDAWLNSPDHRANIEGDFSHFGISIKTDSVTGKKYYTNIFIKK